MLGHLGCCQGYYCPRLIISNQYVKLPERRSLTKNSRPVPIVIYHTDSVISKQINSSSQNSPIIPEPLGIDICDTYRVGKTKQKIKAKKYRWSYPSLPTGTSNKPTPIPSAIAGLHVSPSATVNQQTAKFSPWYIKVQTNSNLQCIQNILTIQHFQTDQMQYKRHYTINEKLISKEIFCN